MAEKWTPRDSDDLYNVSRWGGGYFKIGDQGDLIAMPRGPGQGEVNLREVVEDLRGRGIMPPVLLRFSDILGKRIEEINTAFKTAIEEYGFKGSYRSVVP